MALQVPELISYNNVSGYLFDKIRILVICLASLSEEECTLLDDIGGGDRAMH